MTKMIVVGLQQLNPYVNYIADFFLIFSVLFLLFAIYKRGKPIAKIAPTLLTGLGLIGTLLIASIAMSVFDIQEFDKSIARLLSSLGIALFIGLVGIMSALAIKTINNEINKQKQLRGQRQEITPAIIYLVLKEISTNSADQKTLLTDIAIQSKELQSGIQKTIELQQAHFVQEAHLLETIKNELSSGNFEVIPLQQLAPLMQGLHQQLKDYKHYSENFQQLHQQAKQAFPLIEKNLHDLTQGMHQKIQNCLDLLETSLETQLDMAEASLESQLEKFTALQDNFIHSGNQIASNSIEKLASPTSLILSSNDGLNNLKLDEYDALLNNAYKFMELGHYDQAIANFDQAIKFNPQEFSGFYNKACCCALQGQMDLTIGALQQAISLNAECRLMANTDSDFDNIRHDARFQDLML